MKEQLLDIELDTKTNSITFNDLTAETDGSEIVAEPSAGIVSNGFLWEVEGRPLCALNEW